MRKLFVVIAMCAAAASCVPAYADWSVKDMNRTIDQTNFLVNDNCSGTLIDKVGGFILTANHCITDQFKTVERETIGDDGEVKKTKVRVTVPGSVSQIVFAGQSEVQRAVYVFKVVAHDAEVDLGLLQVKSKLPNATDAKIACTAPERGEVVYAVGNPFVALYSTVTKGIVASTARDYNLLGVANDFGAYDNGTRGLVQHTAPIEGGNSGGALYNDQGDLVGVNVRSSRVNETIAFAVPLGDIRAFLDKSDLKLKDCTQ
jgi:S1-C subfamily serine protease